MRRPSQFSALAETEHARAFGRYEFWLDDNSTAYPCNANEKEYNYVGCVTYKLSGPFVNNGPSANNELEPVKVVHFIDNWITIFNALMDENNHDEFGERAPSFKAAVDVLFSIQIISLTLVLTIYMTGVEIAQAVVENTKDAITSKVITLVSHWIVIIIYFWGCFIYRGQLFPRVKKTDRPASVKGESKFDIFGIRMICVNIYKLAIELYHGSFASAMSKDTAHREVSTDWSVQYAPSAPTKNPVTLDSKIDTKISSGNLEMKARPHHLSEGVIEDSKDGQHTVTVAPSPPEPEPEKKKRMPLVEMSGAQRYSLETCHVPMSTCFLDTLNANTMYLVYLSPDNAFQHREGGVFCFRGRSHELLRVFFFLVIIGNLFLVGYHAYILEVDAVSIEDDYAIESAKLYLSFTIYYLIPLVQGILLYSSLAVIFDGLLLSGDMAHELCKSWLRRYYGVRRIRLEDPEDDSQEKRISELRASSSSDPLTERDRLAKLLRLAPTIRRDAFERLLFVRHFMESASELWSPLLAFIFTCCVLFVLFTYALLLQLSKYTFPHTFPLITSLVIEGIVILMPVYCVAYANARVDDIRTLFESSAPGDYAVLGSIDEWSVFIRNTSLYWRVYGVAVTYGVLQSLVSTFVGIIPALVGFFSYLIYKA